MIFRPLQVFPLTSICIKSKSRIVQDYITELRFLREAKDFVCALCQSFVPGHCSSIVNTACPGHYTARGYACSLFDSISSQGQPVYLPDMSYKIQTTGLGLDLECRCARPDAGSGDSSECGGNQRSRPGTDLLYCPRVVVDLT
ncbi:hypothetical protein RRG08_017364 [Elysia crispata]|uniref:Uncharacterized protein n=1 Tax=Elysia crispata TaxID=231223 RepID=A0AAE1E129_9GAST|nr:hypothetical protein RRG08_017364 [Elysia crispata]